MSLCKRIRINNRWFKTITVFSWEENVDGRRIGSCVIACRAEDDPSLLIFVSGGAGDAVWVPGSPDAVPFFNEVCPVTDRKTEF